MKDPKKEAIIEGSSSSTLDKEAIAEGSFDVEEKDVIEEGSSSASPLALPRASGGQVIQPASVNVSFPPRVVEENSEQASKAYSCRFCTKQFPTAQALGGHQNTHKAEREFAKRQKMFKNLTSNSNCSSLGLTQPNYCDRFSNSLSIGRPQLPSYNYNFTLPRTPLAYPYSSTPGFLNPRSTTGFPSGQSSNPSGGMLLNNIQLQGLERPRMTCPYTGNNSNYNYRSGGEGSMLGGSRAPVGNRNSMGNDLTLSLETLNENRRFPGDGFEARGTSSGMSRNLFGLSLGLGSHLSSEIQDISRGHDESDGSIDLLSRVGMGSEEDAETSGDRGNKES